ncbi:MAG TPA: CBS domain-containing protein [Stellaceae bacterium]|jgi:CBS-domain-containing membrane protein|nr:CBS domain-containing protein [Stellaceae bacterium]
MLAKEIMTTAVVAIGMKTKICDIARLLIAHGISAVPVIDDNGAPIGMVSEGDLIGRGAAEKTEKRDWWLSLLAEGEELSAEYLHSLRPSLLTAEDVMATPVITVDEATDIQEIARLLNDYHIKRVPVIKDDRIVGIVSRADLVRALAAERDDAATASSQRASERLVRAIDAIDHRFRLPIPQESQHVIAPASPANRAISARLFRDLVAKYHEDEHRHRAALDRAAADARQSEIKALAEHHVDSGAWAASLERALAAAEHGETEFLLLRFPNALCSDGGRAINAPTSDWPKSLRGEAAEFYLRWERELKPIGFHLQARVLEFPKGLPGDIGLFLSWGPSTAS